MQNNSIAGLPDYGGPPDPIDWIKFIKWMAFVIAVTIIISIFIGV